MIKRFLYFVRNVFLFVLKVSLPDFNEGEFKTVRQTNLPLLICLIVKGNLIFMLNFTCIKGTE